MVSRAHGTGRKQQALPGEHEPDLLLHQCGAARFGQQRQLLEQAGNLVSQSGNHWKGDGVTKEC